MGASKKYLIVNDNTRVPCKSRVAFKGDTVTEDEVLRPHLLEALASVDKVKEVSELTDAEKKAKADKKAADKKADEDKAEADKKADEDKAAKKKAPNKKPK